MRKTQKPLNFVELLEWLVKDKIITQEEALRVRKNAHLESVKKKHPLVFLAGQNLKSASAAFKILTMEVLLQWLSKRVGIDYFHIDPLKIDFTQIGNVMSGSYASRLKILPVSIQNKELVIATSEPFVTEWVEDLERATRTKIKRVLVNPLDIERYLVEFFTLAQSVKNATTSMKMPGATSFEHLVELGKKSQNLDANDQHIVRIVDWLWQFAFEQRASDIHLEPRRDISRVRFRIDGVLHVVYQMPTSVMLAVLSRVKLLARLDVVEKRRPQDGRIKTKMPTGEEIELRLSTLPTAFGEKLVMRIFDPSVLMRDLSQMGLVNENQQRWQKMIKATHGLVLVTGPTGSGKTTTLYSTLKQLSDDSVNVCTLEDPIEMIEPRFNQMQVQPQLDLDFVQGVRALMRQDPDIIMIGEVRDLQTAEMAVQAALTGHLVLATLHTNDAPSAIVRLLDLGLPFYLIQSTLLGVMAQRLVRLLCPHCKKEVQTDECMQQTWEELVFPYKISAPPTMFEPVGCLACRMTGYQNRVGLYEILLNSQRLSHLIQPSIHLKPLTDCAVEEGMLTLRVSGANKVATGETSLSEVLRVVPLSEQALE